MSRESKFETNTIGVDDLQLQKDKSTLDYLYTKFYNPVLDLPNFPLQDYDAVTIARRDGRAIGFIGIKRVDERRWDLVSSAVDQSFKEEGICTSMIEEAENYVQRTGVKPCRVEVFPSGSYGNELLEFFKGRGFRESGKVGILVKEFK